MIRFGNAASSHSGLIPWKTAYKKRGELLWAIASKKNFNNNNNNTYIAPISILLFSSALKNKNI